MSKKKFTDGLESLFSLSVEENEKEEVLLVVESESPQKAAKPEKKKRAVKRRPSKSFAADLESLFASVSPAPASQKEEAKVTAATATQKKPKSKKEDEGARVFSGLEALLRNTIDPAKYNQTEPNKVKRVTFTFDKEKLARLKKIAKTQKAYLKDILGKVVSEYIEEYEREHGEAG